MTTQSLAAEELAKLRQQFDQVPYPKIALEESPRNRHDDLFMHNMVTSYYLKHRRVVDPKDKLILDAGCGSGYKSLVLAEANPGARIVGVDLSEASVQLARDRLKYHGFENVEFHAMLIEDLPKLGLQFDHINCDETLYLLPDPVAGLQALKQVLKPGCMIRGNFHSAYQRAAYFRTQTLFQMLGIMDEDQEVARESVVATLKSLRDGVRLKREAWNLRWESSEDTLLEILYANHLLTNDKGFTIPDVFSILTQADLEFVSMVRWRYWDVSDLFEEPNNLPSLWGLSLAYASVEEKLRLYELLHPVHRLIDFWCTHSDQECGVPVDDWSDEDWRNALVHLHPQLRRDLIKEKFVQCIEQKESFAFSEYISSPALAPMVVDSAIASSLLPLWDGPQPIMNLVERYRKIHPVDPVSLAPTSELIAFEAIRDLLNRLDAFLYVLLEPASV